MDDAQHTPTDSTPQHEHNLQHKPTVVSTKQRVHEFFSIKETAFKELRLRWGKPLKTYRARKTIAQLHQFTNDDDAGYVDDSTWKDLDMDALFDRLDSNITPIGRQYLYRQLRTYERDVTKLRQQHATASHIRPSLQPAINQ